MQSYNGVCFPKASGCLTVKTNSCWRCLLPSLRAALPLTASVPPAFFPVTMSRNRFSASCGNQPHSSVPTCIHSTPDIFQAEGLSLPQHSCSPMHSLKTHAHELHAASDRHHACCFMLSTNTTDNVKVCRLIMERKE